MSTSSTRDDEASVSGFSSALKLALLPFLLSRAWVFAFAYWGQSIYAGQGRYLQPFKGGWQGVDNWWLNVWTTYDSERFVHVAQRGYDVVTSVSFPLYSILLTPFRGSEVMMAAWGVLLSNGAFLLALTFLYKLTQRDFNDSIAKLTVWATAFFPATVIFSAVYAESLFLLLVVFTFWFARMATNKGWLLAGVFGLLAGLTRNSGPILFVALLIEYSMQHKAAKKVGSAAPSFLCALATTTPLFAFIGFQLYLKSVLGGSDLMLKQAHALGRDWMWPWIPLFKEVSYVANGHRDIATLVNFGVTLLAVAVLFAFWRRGRATYTTFLGGMLLAFTTYGMTFPPYTIGAMRYLAVTFPLQQRLGIAVSEHARKPLFRALLIAAALLTSAIVAIGFGLKKFLF